MTVRLAEIALGSWDDIDGFAVSRGMADLRELPLDRFANFIWWFLTRNASQEDRERVRNRIWQPPKGELPPAKSPWSAENETKAFRALKQTLGMVGAS